MLGSHQESKWVWPMSNKISKANKRGKWTVRNAFCRQIQMTGANVSWSDKSSKISFNKFKYKPKKEDISWVYIIYVLSWV